MVRVKAIADGTLTVTAQFNGNSELNNVVQHVVKNGSAVDVTQYHLVCVTCSDGELYDQARGVLCRVWFDQIPKQTFFKDEVLRENGGLLYVNPEFPASTDGKTVYPISTHSAGKATIRNLTYHNHAFNSEKVFEAMYNENTIVNRPYVPKVASGEANDYMKRALRLQQQYLW
jgi:hypothetical protein